MKNWKLKKAFFQSGITQKTVALLTGLAEAQISMAINGKYNLDEDQKSKLAEALHRSKNDLFEN